MTTATATTAVSTNKNTLGIVKPSALSEKRMAYLIKTQRVKAKVSLKNAAKAAGKSRGWWINREGNKQPIGADYDRMMNAIVAAAEISEESVSARTGRKAPPKARSISNKKSHKKKVTPISSVSVYESHISKDPAKITEALVSQATTGADDLFVQAADNLKSLSERFATLQKAHEELQAEHSLCKERMARIKADLEG